MFKLKQEKNIILQIIIIIIIIIGPININKTILISKDKFTLIQDVFTL